MQGEQVDAETRLRRLEAGGLPGEWEVKVRLADLRAILERVRLLEQQADEFVEGLRNRNEKMRLLEQREKGLREALETIAADPVAEQMYVAQIARQALAASPPSEPSDG